MIEDVYKIVLWLAVGWPLLLSVPVFHARISQCRVLAILPALALIIPVAQVSVEMPWFVFGSSFAIDGDRRWIMAVCAVIWLIVAGGEKSGSVTVTADRGITWFMLSVAGNLGAILAADRLGFLVFSTMMGYGIYALWVQHGDEPMRRAGRIYIMAMIVADLALLDALQLAVYTGGGLHGEASGATIVSTEAYIWMVLIAFALKAAIWPFHWWLAAAIRLGTRAGIMLSAALPVIVGLYGAVQWLPLGLEIPPASWVSLPLAAGIGACVYLLVGMRRGGGRAVWPARTAITLGALCFASLGVALVRPAVWMVFAGYAPVAIALVGASIVAAMLVKGDGVEAGIGEGGQGGSSWVPRVVTAWCRARRRLQSVLSVLQRLWAYGDRRRRQWIARGQAIARSVGWEVAITIFVLLGLLLARLAG